MIQFRGALNEVSRLRQKDDNWKPMSSLEPHEAAIEQLIHDDADDGIVLLPSFRIPKLLIIFPCFRFWRDGGNRAVT
jgi:hypothetical protein